MPTKTVDKVAWGIFAIGVFIVFCFIILLGWGFIELVQWITSK